MVVVTYLYLHRFTVLADFIFNFALIYPLLRSVLHCRYQETHFPESPSLHSFRLEFANERSLHSVWRVKERRGFHSSEAVAAGCHGFPDCPTGCSTGSYSAADQEQGQDRGLPLRPDKDYTWETGKLTCLNASG